MTAHKTAKCKAKKAGPMPPRWLNVIGSMIHGGMDFQAAMAESGYSPAYYKTSGHLIKQDPRFNKRFEEELAKTRAKSEPRRAKRMRDLDVIIENPDTLQRDRIAAIQLQGRMCGWLSETIRHEAPERQKQIDDSMKHAARRLAIMLQDTTRLPDAPLPAKAVACQVIDSEADERDTESLTSCAQEQT